MNALFQCWLLNTFYNLIYCTLSIGRGFVVALASASAIPSVRVTPLIFYFLKDWHILNIEQNLLILGQTIVTGPMFCSVHIATPG